MNCLKMGFNYHKILGIWTRRNQVLLTRPETIFPVTSATEVGHHLYQVIVLQKV